MKKYLGYVAGGVCRDTHADTRDADGNWVKPPMIRKQFWVQEELRRLGVTAWCGKKVEFKRLGKDRTWTRFDEPSMPNYIILEMSWDQVFIATQVEHLMPTFRVISGADLHGSPATKDRPACIGLEGFIAMVESEFQKAERVDANSRASVTAYKKGQQLRVINGPFADMLVSFDKLVKAPHDRWQAISVELPSGIKAQFDPLDVKSA